MPNKQSKNAMPRKKRTITLPQDVLDWIDKEIKEKRRFGSLSHAIEYCVYKVMREKEEEKVS